MEATTTPNQTPEPEYNSGGTVAFYVYATFIGSLGLIGNSFVILVILRYHKVFNSTTNKLILHQSVVDFLAALLFLLRQFLVVTSRVPDDILGSLYCRLWWSELPQYGMFVTSTYNMVAISMERYVATCHPVSHRMLTTGRLKFIIVAAWLSGWLSELHLVPISHQTDNACNRSWFSPTVQALGGILIFLWELVIPLSVMTYAYTRIIRELRKRSKARIGGTNDAQNMLSNANKNVTKTLFVVAIFFAICWMPTGINYFLYNLGLNDTFTVTIVNQAAGAIVLVNLCINPVIYCFTYDRFKKQAKKMVCGGWRRGHNRVDNSDESATRTRNTAINTTVETIT